METAKQEKGKKGEQMAADYLRSKGYQILETNWRMGHLEVDIIAIGNNMLVFVEVKTRATNAFGEPEVFVDLDIAGPGNVANLHHRLPKIRSGVKIVKTRRHNAKQFSRSRPQIRSVKQFVFPQIV